MMFSQSRIFLMRPFSRLRIWRLEKLLATVTTTTGECRQERGRNLVEEGNLVVVRDVEGTTCGGNEGGEGITSISLNEQNLLLSHCLFRFAV